jgi:hypothetical protein
MGPNGEVIALLFNASELRWRHQSILHAGASWDWEEYQPHITIGDFDVSMDLSKIEPYRGEIILGPEIWQELKPDWIAPKKNVQATDK